MTMNEARSELEFVRMANLEYGVTQLRYGSNAAWKLCRALAMVQVTKSAEEIRATHEIFAIGSATVWGVDVTWDATPPTLPAALHETKTDARPGGY